MNTATDAITIRPALPHEIDLAIAIDDDACALFEQAGVHFNIGPTHPFAQSEYARWAHAVGNGNGFFAEWPGQGPVGFLVMGSIDGAPYLDQVSVRTQAMRRGMGRHLISRAIDWARGQTLWLTTYSHLPWNRPYYERLEFTVVPESRCPRGVIEVLDEQRRWLPHPAERIAMRRMEDGRFP